MKLFQVIAPCVSLLLPVLAAAAPAIDPDVLGQIEAKRDFCSRIDPAGAKERTDLITALMQQFSQEELQATRQSDAYKASYGQQSSQLGELDAKAAASTCAIKAH